MKQINHIIGYVLGCTFLLAGCSENPSSDLTSVSASLIESQNSEATTYSGRATVVNATLLSLPPIILSDAGPLPNSGGEAEATLLEAEVPGVLTAQVLHAATIGQGNRAFSESSVANLRVTVAGNTITASFLRSQAEALCNDDGTATVRGNSEIVALQLNGTPISVSGTPNQEVPLLGAGKIIINEQRGSASGGSGDFTVNALHVIVPGVADIVIASAHADIVCRGPRTCVGSGDFVTGGGWITAGGSRGTFAAAGGLKNDALWGHLTYIDHGTGLKVKGTGVTDYEFIDPTTRRIEGTAEINGSSGTYDVIVSDAGEPGRDDRFRIQLSNGYNAAGLLAGGNIQLHARPLPCN
jgi:hypothetical protein